MLESSHEILANPRLLSGKTPAEIEWVIGRTPGWRVETLGRGSHEGRGWVLREYDDAGNPTGSVIRWHPGGGHHGPNPYWRVSSPRYGRSGEIPVKALDYTGTQQELLEQLIVAISRLARPAEGQIAYLETLGPGTTADELALELDDVAEAAVAVPGLLSQRQRDLVRALDVRLHEMSGPDRDELWSQQALRASPVWSQVRADARAALSDLHGERAVAK